MKPLWSHLAKKKKKKQRSHFGHLQPPNNFVKDNFPFLSLSLKIKDLLRTLNSLIHSNFSQREREREREIRERENGAEEVSSGGGESEGS